MLYPTHIVSVYLLIAATDLSSAGLLLGAALPDIIDKPLPRFDIVETYHSVAHSVVPTALILAVGYFNPVVLAIGVGFAFHILLDLIHVAINGRPSHWRFILWPFDFHDEPMKKPPRDFFGYYIGTRCFYVEIAIWMTIVFLISTRGLTNL